MAILVLLQGLNLLPNYVVAKDLLVSDPLPLGEPVEEILVFYEAKTKENFWSATIQQAHRLKKEIAKLKPGQVQFTLKALSNVHERQWIRRDIERGLEPFIAKQQHIHLSYSGGTKPISVHSYMMAQTACKTSGATFTASYLDARHHQLYWDQATTGSHSQQSIAADHSMELTIKEFLALSGYEMVPGQTGSEGTEDSLQDLLLTLWKNQREQYERIQSAVKSLYYLETDYQNNVGAFKDRVEVVKSQLDWKALEPVVPYLPTLQLIQDGTYSRLLTKAGLSDDEATVKCIAGRWYAGYVRQQIAQVVEKNNPVAETPWHLSIPDTFGQSLVAKRPGQDNFELDIYFIVGYQLIGIAVTTEDSAAVSKSMGFEVIHRTQQIGGDGSVAFLVTLLPDDKRDDLQKALESDTDIGKRFQVFGQSDFETIGSKIVDAVYDAQE